MKIKKNDNIIVISGKDKGRQGKVIKVLPGRFNDGKVIVENVNLKKKHQRPKTAGKKGEKIETPRPIFISTVALICRNCGKPARTGSKIMNDKKIRICKKCGLET